MWPPLNSQGDEGPVILIKKKHPCSVVFFDLANSRKAKKHATLRIIQLNNILLFLDDKLTFHMVYVPFDTCHILILNTKQSIWRSPSPCLCPPSEAKRHRSLLPRRWGGNDQGLSKGQPGISASSLLFGPFRAFSCLFFLGPGTSWSARHASPQAQWDRRGEEGVASPTPRGC